MMIENFNSIRAAYEKVLPEWMADYERTGDMMGDAYLFDWSSMFTRIEQWVWGDIRYHGIPFFPQFPVLKYFTDFGCPFLKIAIECDGKDFHDPVKDAKRDKEFASEGWTVFRLTGSECVRSVQEPWDPENENPDLEKFFMHTSEGLIYSIKNRIFEDEHSQFARKHFNWIEKTILKHNKTPQIRLPHFTNDRRKTTSPSL